MLPWQHYIPVLTLLLLIVQSSVFTVVSVSLNMWASYVCVSVCVCVGLCVCVCVCV